MNLRGAIIRPALIKKNSIYKSVILSVSNLLLDCSFGFLPLSLQFLSFRLPVWLLVMAAGKGQAETYTHDWRKCCIVNLYGINPDLGVLVKWKDVE